VLPLAAEALCRRCNPESLAFGSTSELEDLTEIVGQDRAVAAIAFGIGIRRAGYNLFVLGPSASGKHTIVRQYVEHKARAEPIPSDWCYVNNLWSRRRGQRVSGRARRPALGAVGVTRPPMRRRHRVGQSAGAGAGGGRRQ
jgi:hypothetical protein